MAKNVKTILAALDLAAGSDAVLVRAIQLATAHAARLHVLHVIEAEPLSHVAALSDRSENDLRNELKRHALSMIETLLIENGRTRRTKVNIEFGAPHAIVTHVAGERGADVIVIGPGKGHSLKEKVLGSTADRVIRTAAASILVVRRESAEPYRQVVAAVDFSPQSATAAKEARKLFPEAAMQLVHAVDTPLTLEQAMLRSGTSQIEMQRYRSAKTEKAGLELSTFAHDVFGAGKVVARVVEGEPSSTLVHLSRDHHVDLVAVGTHGRGVVLQALLGSVAQKVLKEAGCDVLIASNQQSLAARKVQSTAS